MAITRQTGTLSSHWNNHTFSEFYQRRKLRLSIMAVIMQQTCHLNMGVVKQSWWPDNNDRQEQWEIWSELFPSSHAPGRITGSLTPGDNRLDQSEASIQVTWSLSTNQRPVSRSRDHRISHSWWQHSNSVSGPTRFIRASHSTKSWYGEWIEVTI